MSGDPGCNLDCCVGLVLGPRYLVNWRRTVLTRPPTMNAPCIIDAFPGHDPTWPVLGIWFLACSPSLGHTANIPELCNAFNCSTKRERKGWSRLLIILIWLTEVTWWTCFLDHALTYFRVPLWHISWTMLWHIFGFYFDLFLGSSFNLFLGYCFDLILKTVTNLILKSAFDLFLRSV